MSSEYAPQPLPEGRIHETTAVMQVGFSPCPNDTFMFHGLLHGQTPCEGVALEPVIEDIEQLNLRAISMVGELSLTKLSVAALGRCADRYRVLQAGAALGRGVGPLIVRAQARAELSDLAQLSKLRVAVPGQNTSANLLLRIMAPQDVETVIMPFDQIMAAVAGGKVDAGVVIHEGRFTYEAMGLHCIADLGAVWESQTNLPLPLGVICTHRAVDVGLSGRLSAALAASVEHAFAHPDHSWEFTREHSQELSQEVCRKHIDLYVNEFSRDLGDEGREAIELMLRRGHEAGVFSSPASPW